jgi:hypothetical protein
MRELTGSWYDKWFLPVLKYYNETGSKTPFPSFTGNGRGGGTGWAKSWNPTINPALPDRLISQRRHSEGRETASRRMRRRERSVES